MGRPPCIAILPIKIPCRTLVSIYFLPAATLSFFFFAPASAATPPARFSSCNRPRRSISAASENLHLSVTVALLRLVAKVVDARASSFRPPPPRSSFAGSTPRCPSHLRLHRPSVSARSSQTPACLSSTASSLHPFRSLAASSSTTATSTFSRPRPGQALLRAPHQLSPPSASASAPDASARPPPSTHECANLLCSAPGLVGRGPSSRPFSVFSGLDGRRPRLLVVVPPPACSAPSPRTSGGSIAMHVFLVYVRTDDLQVPCDLVQKNPRCSTLTRTAA